MQVIIDIEADALESPKNIWVIVCKDIDTGKVEIFREVTKDAREKDRFLSYARNVNRWIGHNVFGYDLNVLGSLIGLPIRQTSTDAIDTLIVSKLVDYSRDGHSLESYGIEFGYPKGKNFYENFFGLWSQELEDYCVKDVEITHRVYLKYLHVVMDRKWDSSLRMEHDFQLVVNELHSNGFSFNHVRANGLLEKVKKDLGDLDEKIQEAFPTRVVKIREIYPKLTRHGTLNKSDFRWYKSNDLTEFNGGPFTRIVFEPFNPSSHRQIINVLSNAKWVPTEKTKTHIETIRSLNRKAYQGDADKEVLEKKLEDLKITGWKINEENLSTLPAKAPEPARLLARRILLESRRRTLTEWLGLVRDDSRIHGKFIGLGAWTHRMAHQSPNTANIPNEYDTSGKVKLLGKEMRGLWQAPRKRLLVGVDAEGIQLRLFAHYIDEKEFTDALVRGRKEDKTDPHSLNQRILGNVCKTRAAGKRFIYALLLGAGLDKLAEILECSREEAEQALNRLMDRYTGFQRLKKTTIPKDARRGYFIGLDGRAVNIPGDTEGARRHLVMSGYLQNGEAVVMKRATLKWHHLLKEKNAILVNFVHDEWQTECPNNVDKALEIAKIQADSLREVGEELGLKCPLAGSYWNDDHKDYTIGTNWYQTH